MLVYDKIIAIYNKTDHGSFDMKQTSSMYVKGQKYIVLCLINLIIPWAYEAFVTWIGEIRANGALSQGIVFNYHQTFL